MYLSDIKINYLYNSGFVVETKNHLLVFDYYLDTKKECKRNIENGFLGSNELTTTKTILVFCSHSHPDHFNSVIFSWKDFNNNISYILSSDIKEKKSNNIHYMSPYNTLKLGNTHIETFGSTDLGVSFLVNVDGISIFHAGDLNWWDWFDESNEYNLNMEKDFKSEISKIKLNNIDVAFFPIDPRLKQSYYLGGEYFIKETKPKMFIPMHFGDNYEVTNKFADKFKTLDCKISTIHERGEQLYF